MHSTPLRLICFLTAVEAIVAMKGLGGARAMELFKEVEEKFEQIRNPSSYLKTAAARENPSVQGRGMPQTALALAPFPSRRPDADPATKIHRRASWLNANVFPDRQIDPEAWGNSLTLRAWS